MLRMGLVVVAVWLAFPAAAMADGTVSIANSTYVLTADAENDGIVVEVGQDNNSGNPGYWFRPIDSAQTFITGACENPAGTGGGRVCLPGAAQQGQLDLNGGNDTAIIALDFTPLAEFPVTVNAGPGDDDITSGSSDDTLNGEAGDDTMRVRGSGVVSGGTNIDTAVFPTGPASVRLDGIANDGPFNANVLTDVENVDGSPQSDSLTGSAAANHLRGLGDVDSLNGLGGADVLDGGTGGDVIFARDGVVDTVICGAGADTANVDANDNVNADCETVNRAAPDADGDGFGRGPDCNDTNKAIHPGARDIPNNGVDEDCSGADTKVDGDGDGAIPPADCDDTTKARHPGARDKPRNGVDEDCNGRDADWRRNRASITTGWESFTSYTLVTRLTFADLPARAKVRLRCRGGGCPFSKKALRVRRRKASATKLFQGDRLAPGALLEIRITAPDTMGKVVRYRIRSRALPTRRQLCLAPGKKKPGRCG